MAGAQSMRSSDLRHMVTQARASICWKPPPHLVPRAVSDMLQSACTGTTLRRVSGPNSLRRLLREALGVSRVQYGDDRARMSLYWPRLIDRTSTQSAMSRVKTRKTKAPVPRGRNANAAVMVFEQFQDCAKIRGLEAWWRSRRICKVAALRPGSIPRVHILAANLRAIDGARCSVRCSHGR
jgi:hypothetical protein